LSKPAEPSSMKPVVEEARSDSKATRLGTVFSSGVDLSGKKLGIGVMNGLIGGSAFSYGIQLATFSVYHRYLRYRHHRYPLQRNEGYYAAFYSQNSCYQGCPLLSHCEWGICECDAGHKKRHGLCLTVQIWNSPTSTQAQHLMPDNEIGVGRRCREASNCNNIDINLICVELTDGRKECQCRKDMQWNEEARECQFFIGVDCTNLSFEDTPSTNVANAVLQHQHTIRGWKTEEDKREKIFKLPKIQKMMEKWMGMPIYYANYHNQSVIDYLDWSYERLERVCPPSLWAVHGAVGWSQRKIDFYDKYNERCKVSELLEDEIEVNISSVPTERTQTPEEALQLSIWSPHNTFDLSILSGAELDEAFCRDIESFSPAFTPRVTPPRIQG